MTDLPPEKLHRLRNDVLALEAAAALAYDHLYVQSPADKTPTWASSDARNALAHAISSLTLLYVPSVDRTAFRRLIHPNLKGGRFSEGGSVLRFDDGRPEISGICIQTSLLREVIMELKRLRGTIDELTSDYTARRRDTG